MSKINLNTFAGGALAEKVNDELQKILDNIDDPNTNAVTARKLTITITMKPNQRRDGVAAQINAKATLAPIIPVETMIIIGRNNQGQVEATEMYKGRLPGQIEMDLAEIDTPASNPGVIDLRKIKDQENKEVAK